jgi:rare lipoprotein A
MEGQHLVRGLTITGGLTLVLVSALAEARVWEPPPGQVGWASWHGARHHGRKTASGERFSMHDLTAAHRSLPLGTPVLVTHLNTGQQVHVTIHDRGLFVDQPRRIIDLSRAAAERIG